MSRRFQNVLFIFAVWFLMEIPSWMLPKSWAECPASSVYPKKNLQCSRPSPHEALFPVPQTTQTSSTMKTSRWRRRAAKGVYCRTPVRASAKPCAAIEVAHDSSRIRTWRKFHGPGNFLPLTVESMNRVARAMKAKNYRSIKNYLSCVRKAHLKADHAWPSSLSIAFQECCSLAKKRLGPARRARCFSIYKLAAAYAAGKIVKTRLVAPFATVSLSTLCLLRSIETGAVNCADVTISILEACVSVKVTSSKTDVTARGVRIRWHCLCGLPLVFNDENAQAWMACPFHCALFFATAVHSCSTDDFSVAKAVPGGEKPFFPVSGGGRIVARDIGKFLTALALVADIVDPDIEEAPSGAAFGGHSMRRSGCMHHHTNGMPDQTLRRLARWRSQIVESYLGQAPLSALGPWTFSTGSCGWRAAPAQVPSVELLLGDVRRRLRQLFEEAAASQAPGRTLLESASVGCPHDSLSGVAGGRNQITQTEPCEKFREQFLVSRARQDKEKCHRIQNLHGHATTWRTRCGFKFAGARVSLVHREEMKPGLSLCDKCFPDQKLGAS